jgi:hypothetical protein
VLARHSHHACRTSTVSELASQGVIKKRCRGAQGAPVGAEEAAALHWLRTGEEAASEAVITAGVERVREALRQEAAGLSHCGVCSSCIQGNGCIRANNRRAAREGKQGARWAEEGVRLTGRFFEVRTSLSQCMGYRNKMSQQSAMQQSLYMKKGTRAD